MNKTVNINIGGIVFHIEENAFEQLGRYLESIRAYFNKQDGSEEIMADIESRIAELLQGMLKESGREVVLPGDVEAIKSAMGKPEEFTGGTDTRTSGTRRFFRDTDNKVIGGVLSGISAYFNIDPVWLRLIFIGALFLWGTGIIIYIILWIIIPEAKTAAEKLEMRGEAVNVGNIEKTVREELESLRRRVEAIRSGKGIPKARSVLGQIIDGIISVLSAVLTFTLRFAGLIIAVAGIALLIAGLMTIIGTTVLVPMHLPVFFSSSPQMLIGLIGIMLAAGIPLAGLSYFGLKLLFGIPPMARGISIGLGLSWVAGLIMAGFTAGKIAHDFSRKGTIRVAETIETESDTLYLDVTEPYDSDLDEELLQDFGRHFILTRQKSKYGLTSVYLDIKKASGDHFEVVETKVAYGPSRKEAHYRAGEIEYMRSHEGNRLLVSPLLFFDEGNFWRRQEVRLVVMVPDGKTVYLDPRLKFVIYDIDNVSNTHDHDMPGNYWTMTQKGLECAAFSNSGSGKLPTGFESIQIPLGGSFSNIDVEGSFELRIDMGKTESVSCTYFESDEDEFETEVRENTLYIRQNKSLLDRLERSHKAPRFDITLSKLNAVKSEGANSMTSGRLRGETISIELTGASDADISLEAEQLVLQLTGASKMELKGRSGTMTAEMSGACKLDADQFQVEDAVLTLAGACKAEVEVTRRLEVESSGASRVLYSGDPELIAETEGASRILRK